MVNLKALLSSLFLTSPAELHLLKVSQPPKTAPPDGDHVFKRILLWRMSHIQIPAVWHWDDGLPSSSFLKSLAFVHSLQNIFPNHYVPRVVLD